MTNVLQIKELKNGLALQLHVIPHASHALLVGAVDGLIKIKVTALPVEGAANEACIKLLSKEFALRKNQMEILAGAKSRKKTVLIKEISRDELEIKINRALKR